MNTTSMFSGNISDLSSEGFIQTTHGKTYYHIFGKEKKGIPLILVHGGPGATHYYLEPLKALADERPVIFYDQLGCGKSREIADSNFMTIEYFVDELATLISILQLKEYHLLGNSWGTMLITEFIGRKNPSQLKRIIFSGSFLNTKLWIEDQLEYLSHFPGSIQNAIKISEEKLDFANPDYQNAITMYYQKHLCRLEEWPASLNKAFENFGAEVYNTMWGPSEFTVTGILKDADSLPKFAEIKIPILLICGEFDESTPKRNFYYASINPNAKVEEIKDAAHEHHLEKPEEFILLCRNFLSQ